MDIQELHTLSESALRDHHGNVTARIAEIDQTENRTLELVRERRELVQQANAIATVINDINSNDDKDVSIIDVVEPITAEDAAATTDNDSAASVVEEVREPQTTTITNFTPDQVEELAEAVAASTALRRSVADTAAASTDAVIVATERPVASLTASAATTRGTVTAGAPINLDAISELVVAMAHDRGANGQNVPLVNLTAAPVLNAAGEPIMVRSDAGGSSNTRAITEALTAAPFEICGPPDILRDVPECDNTQRYVPNWFRTVQSTHGSIEFYRSFGIADVAGAVNVWGQEEQDGIDPADESTWKPCATVGCLPTDTISVEAVVQCLCMPLFQQMTSPEAVASAINAVRGLTARVADGQLLGFLDKLTSQYTFDASATPLGATIQLYDMLGRLLGIFATADRQLDLSGYTLAVEVGMLETLTLDNLMRCNPSAASEAANSLFGSLGVGNIVITPDFSLADGAGPWSPLLPVNPVGAAAKEIPPRPTDFKLRLFRNRDFVMLSPGGDTFGIVPDYNNKRQNKVCWFGEIFQGLGKIGCSPAATIEVTGLTANGVRAACA